MKSEIWPTTRLLTMWWHFYDIFKGLIFLSGESAANLMRYLLRFFVSTTAILPVTVVTSCVVRESPSSWCVCVSFVIYWNQVNVGFVTPSPPPPPPKVWPVHPKVQKMPHASLMAEVMNPARIQVDAEESLVETRRRSTSGPWLVGTKRLLSIIENVFCHSLERNKREIRETPRYGQVARKCTRCSTLH